MSKQPPSKKKYNKVYMKEKCKTINLLLNKNTDQDIIQFLDNVENRNAYLKNLIRKDINK